jgi:hypothetical protein
LLVAKSPARLTSTLFLCAAAFFATPLCMFVSLAVALHVLFVAVAAIICAVCNSGPRAFREAVLGATVAGYAVAALFALGDYERQQKLAEKYAFEWLAPRLAYEADVKSHPTAVEVQGSHALSSRWQQIEERQKNYSDHFSFRRAGLQQIHDKTLQNFITSPSFGVGRMTHLASEERLATGNDPPVAQSARKGDPDGSPDPGATIAAGGPEAPGLENAIGKLSQDQFWHSHTGAIKEFLEPDRYGLIRSREEVAGFFSHRLGPSANMQLGEKLPAPDRVELVSLLKFSEPRVYISENLPAMDELRDAPTRGLDAFEQNGLAVLKSGEDIVSEHGPETIRALGALRALKQCLQCHTAAEGQLLGAFSYRWGPAKPTPQAVPPTPDAT